MLEIAQQRVAQTANRPRVPQLEEDPRAHGLQEAAGFEKIGATLAQAFPRKDNQSRFHEYPADHH